MLNIKYKISRDETRPSAEAAGKRLNIVGTSVQNYISIFENTPLIGKHFNEKLREDLIISLLGFYYRNRRRERYFFLGFFSFFLLFFLI